MGAKTCLAAFVGTDPRTIAFPGDGNPEASRQLLDTCFPGPWAQVGTTDLMDGLCWDPTRQRIFALRAGEFDLITSPRVAVWERLPDHIREVARGRRIVLHVMNSTNDSLTFMVWQAGELVRALIVSPDDGITRDEGMRLAAEQPFWSGQRRPPAGYALPFHPLDLGEELLRAEVGCVIEAPPMPGDLDAMAVTICEFRYAAPAVQRRRRS